MADFFLIKGAVGATMELEVSDASGLVDLTGATVTVSARSSGKDGFSDAVCVPDSDQTANKGKVTYTFDSTTASIPTGEYKIRVKVVKSGVPNFYPNNANSSYLTFIVREDV